MKSVEISRAEKEYNENWCRRCDRYYCLECVSFYIVDFDIEENVNCERMDLPEQIENWKGEQVCPWCYNQLVEKKEKGSL